MKVLKCVPCDRTQKEGKYCLDCGQVLTEIITSGVKFKPMKTNRGSDVLKRAVRTWLNRIGVQNPDIQIYTGGGVAEVTYSLNGQEYRFKSVLQDNVTNNLAAVEQFLHSRVLGIERGLETADKAFKGYEALPDPQQYIRQMSDSALKRELKIHHPDTGDGNLDRFQMLLAEMNRRRGIKVET